jgi:thiaminase
VTSPSLLTLSDVPLVVELHDTASGTALGRATVARAEAVLAPRAVASGAPGLHTALALTRFHLTPSAPRGAAAVLAYAALRAGRTLGRTAVVATSESTTPGLVDLLALSPLAGAEPGLLAGRLDIALHRAATQAQAHGEALLPRFLAQEVSETVQRYVDRVMDTGFFRAVRDGLLTREQYIHVLSQTHQYVRYTTRILGLCVAYSQVTELRDHFLHHLKEEINHEQILERDLSHLGADALYVRDAMAPNAATQQFLLAELALISYFQDPVLLTAAPLAAEGISAHLTKEWISRLERLVASWGIQEPGRATRFFASHIDFDSGEDGHWEGAVRLLEKYLVDEKHLRDYLAAFQACGESLIRCYVASVEETTLWAAPGER